MDATKAAPIVSAAFGKEPAGFAGDGASSDQAQFANPRAIAKGPNGSIYVLDFGNRRIREISPDGLIQTIIGNGLTSSSADGQAGPATSLVSPRGLAVGNDGSVYFTEMDPAGLVKKLTPDGIVHTIAGQKAFSPNIGDGGLATNAFLSSAYSIAIDADGNLYVADYNGNRIRKIHTNGIITTVAGNGSAEVSGDGQRAVTAGILNPSFVAIGSNNEIYIVSGSTPKTVRVVAPDGIIRPFAGNGVRGSAGLNGPATTAQFIDISSVLPLPDGRVLIADFTNIRSVGSDGIFRKFAGTELGVPGIGELPGAAGLTNMNPGAIISYGQGSYLFTSNNQIKIYRAPLPGFNDAGYGIASKDGSEIYQFTSQGRHVQTLFSRTGTVKRKMTYNPEGYLVAITDMNNLTTTLTRDLGQHPTQIQSPYGQLIQLASDSSVTPAYHRT